MGRTRTLHPVPSPGAPDEQLLAHIRELQQLRAENAELHRENEILRRVLHAAAALIAPYGADRKLNVAAKEQTGTSLSGEPQYDD